MKSLIPVLAMLVACVATPAHAWSRPGHRLVGALAEGELNPRARRAVSRLLRGEPEPTLAGVSVWADDVRANDPVLGKRSAPWHYVNVRAGDCTYSEATDCKGANCVVGAIRNQMAILADRRKPRLARQQALKFVVHFVGDVHQPLPAGNRGDKGGNTVQVRVPTPSGGERGSNLHSLWDRSLVELSGRGEDAYLRDLRALPVVAPPLPDGLPPPAGYWATQSCRISRRPGFYPGRARLPAGYVQAWTPVVDEQLRRAGTRLAQLLNRALGQ